MTLVRDDGWWRTFDWDSIDWNDPALWKERFGTWSLAEGYSEYLITKSFTSLSHLKKKDVLTVWKQKDRWRHEVYVPLADPSVRSGMYNRVLNPRQYWLNSRDGISSFLPLRGRTERRLEREGSTETGAWLPLYLGLERSTDLPRRDSVGRAGTDLVPDFHVESTTNSYRYRHQVRNRYEFG